MLWMWDLMQYLENNNFYYFEKNNYLYCALKPKWYERQLCIMCVYALYKIHVRYVL